MGKERYTRRTGLFGSIQVGGGSRIGKISVGTASLNPGSIASVTRGTVAATITGVAAGDVVLMNPPATLNDDLIFAGVVCTTNTATVHLYNPTGGAIDDGALTWTYIWFDVT